jgi:putative membrane protein
VTRLTLPGATFWRQAFTLRGSVTARVLPRTLVVGALACAVTALYHRAPQVAIEPAPFTSSGVILGLLLVFRSGAGYDRWWEARVLWGGITNQCRNLVVSARAYGPADPVWQQTFARWVAAFAHAVRGGLRGERALPELGALVGAEASEEVTAAKHMPSHVAARLASLLSDARAGGMDGFTFLRLDRERALLIDHVGGCERILATPIPHVFSLMTRRFLAMYLLLLPFAFVAPLGWLTPVFVLFVAYPIFSLEQIGAELQNPFVRSSLSHLPLDTMCASLEAELLAVPAVTPRG